MRIVHKKAGRTNWFAPLYFILVTQSLNFSRQRHWVQRPRWSSVHAGYFSSIIFIVEVNSPAVKRQR
jgi:Uma2 family endonuclease